MRRAVLIMACLLGFAAYAGIKPHIFAVPVIVLIWFAYVLVWPHKTCRWCSGWGRKRKKSACSHCKGTGVRFRLSARLASKGAATAIRLGRQWLEQRREAG